MRLAAALALLLLTACASAPAAAPDDVATRFVAAMNALDAGAMRALFAEDATAFLPFPNHRARVTGRDAIMATFTPLFDAERQRNPAGLQLAARDLTVQRFHDTAILTFDVGTEAVNSRRTLVVAWREGGWRIVHLHASNLRPAT